MDGQEGADYRNAANLDASTLADARIPGNVTRDNEVMGIVTANDGDGSTLDADTLDGNNSSSFFKGAKTTQLSNQNLAAGVSVAWSICGNSTNDMVMWWAVPKTLNGKLITTVETQLEGCCGAGQGQITYWVTVRNTGATITAYDLIRYSFNP